MSLVYRFLITVYGCGEGGGCGIGSSSSSNGSSSSSSCFEPLSLQKTKLITYLSSQKCLTIFDETVTRVSKRNSVTQTRRH